MLVLAAGSVLLLLSALAAALAAVAVARHRAASAADLAALAAADRALQGEAAACGAAERVVRSVGAHLGRCRLQGDHAVVVVHVAPAGRLAALGRATATARAGPPSAAPGAARRSGNDTARSCVCLSPGRRAAAVG